MKISLVKKELRFWVAQRLSAARKEVSLSALADEVRRKPPVRIFHALFLAVAVFLFLAAAPTPDARFHDLGHRMMCTCGCAQILLECNHVGCQSSTKMINQLQTALDKGDNDDLILQGFVQEYGPTVIAAPTATGFNRVAWIMPFAVFALGIAFAVQHGAHLEESPRARPGRWHRDSRRRRTRRLPSPSPQGDGPMRRLLRTDN